MIGSNGVTCALPPPPTYVAVAVGPMHEDAVAREVRRRSGSAPPLFFKQRRALLRDVLRDREVGRHQRLQVRPRRHETGVQFAAAAVQPPLCEP